MGIGSHEPQEQARLEFDDGQMESVKASMDQDLALVTVSVRSD